MNKEQINFADEVFTITCEFHKKNSLDNSIYCACHVLVREEIRLYKSGRLLLFGGTKTLLRFFDNNEDGFGFKEFLTNADLRI